MTHRIPPANTKGANLTEEGMKAMNAYASGGYEFLAESRDTKPASPEEFFCD